MATRRLEKDQRAAHIRLWRVRLTPSAGRLRTRSMLGATPTSWSRVYL